MFPIAVLTIATWLPSAIRVADSEHWQTTPIRPIAMPGCDPFAQLAKTERALDELDQHLKDLTRLVQQLDAIDRLRVPEVERECRRQKLVEDYLRRHSLK